MGLSSKHAINGSNVDWSHEKLLKDMEIHPQPQASQGRRQQQQQQQHMPSLKCPRCDSTNTKFCYYNNYNRSQPRHLCKACKRHWTQGGTLRNVPVGGARRNRKRNKNSSTSTTTSNNTNKNPPIRDIPQPLPSSECNYGSFIKTLPIQSPLFPAHYFAADPAISPYNYYSEQQQILPEPTINNSVAPSSSKAKKEWDSSVGGGSIQLLDPSSECWSSWEHDNVNMNFSYIPDDDDL